MLLAQAECRLGIAERLAQVIPDRRDQDRVTHLLLWADPPVAVAAKVPVMFNAHYDERCFLPIHVYDTAVARREPNYFTV
jgi:hypothetical protein